MRHTDARGLSQSGAGEDDRRVPRDVREPSRDLVGRNAHGPLEDAGGIVVAPDVDQEPTALDEREGARSVQPERRGAKHRKRSPASIQAERG